MLCHISTAWQNEYENKRGVLYIPLKLQDRRLTIRCFSVIYRTLVEGAFFSGSNLLCHISTAWQNEYENKRGVLYIPLKLQDRSLTIRCFSVIYRTLVEGAFFSGSNLLCHISTAWQNEYENKRGVLYIPLKLQDRSLTIRCFSVIYRTLVEGAFFSGSNLLCHISTAWQNEYENKRGVLYIPLKLQNRSLTIRCFSVIYRTLVEGTFFSGSNLLCHISTAWQNEYENKRGVLYIPLKLQNRSLTIRCFSVIYRTLVEGTFFSGSNLLCHISTAWQSEYENKRGKLYIPPKLQDRSLTIRCFSVIYRTLIEGTFFSGSNLLCHISTAWQNEYENKRGVLYIPLKLQDRSLTIRCFSVISRKLVEEAFSHYSSRWLGYFVSVNY